MSAFTLSLEDDSLISGEAAPVRILLAEDNPADVYLVREALDISNRRPVELTVVSDGEEALRWVERAGNSAENQLPDLIVLDLNLPKCDGADILRSIRQRANFVGIPVVILTSSDSPKDRKAIETLGATSFMTKPSDLDEFLDVGRKLLHFVEARPNA